MCNNDSRCANDNAGTQLSALCPVDRLIEMVTYLILLQQYTRVRTDDLFTVAQ